MMVTLHKWSLYMIGLKKRIKSNILHAITNKVLVPPNIYIWNQKRQFTMSKHIFWNQKKHIIGRNILILTISLSRIILFNNFSELFTSEIEIKKMHLNLVTLWAWLYHLNYLHHLHLDVTSIFDCFPTSTNLSKHGLNGCKIS